MHLNELYIVNDTLGLHLHYKSTQKQKTSQPTRPGTTVPVFNINSDSAARNVTVISLGIEETL